MCKINILTNNNKNNNNNRNREKLKIKGKWNTWRMRNVRAVNYDYALLLLWKLIWIVWNALYMYLGGIVPIILLAFILCSHSGVYLTIYINLPLSFSISLLLCFFFCILVMHQKTFGLINIFCMFSFVCFALLRIFC